MSNHHRGRRSTPAVIEPVEFPPPVTSPDRPAWVERAYAQIGWDLLQWFQKWGLTSAEYLDLLLRCQHDHVRAMVRSERAAGQSREVGTGQLGGAMTPVSE